MQWISAAYWNKVTKKSPQSRGLLSCTQAIPPTKINFSINNTIKLWIISSWLTHNYPWFFPGNVSTVIRNLLHNKRHGSNFYITAYFYVKPDNTRMGTYIDIITNNDIILSAVRFLFANGRILPYNHILTDLYISVNDDTWMVGQHEVFTNLRTRPISPPYFTISAFFILIAHFRCFLFPDIYISLARHLHRRKPLCLCIPFLISRWKTNVSRMITSAFQYFRRWHFFPDNKNMPIWK